MSIGFSEGAVLYLIINFYCDKSATLVKMQMYS
ncbi:hypothetical protein PSOS111911_18915 [Pseudoalteromonas ostreae]